MKKGTLFTILALLSMSALSEYLYRRDFKNNQHKPTYKYEKYHINDVIDGEKIIFEEDTASKANVLFVSKDGVSAFYVDEKGNDLKIEYVHFLSNSASIKIEGHENLKNKQEEFELYLKKIIQHKNKKLEYMI